MLLNTTQQTGFAFAGELMLPDAHDLPPALLQGACNESVALFVPVQLGPPEGVIVSRLVPMFGAAVPEAAINENREPDLRKDKIRPAEDFAVSAPSSHVIPAEKNHEGHLGLLVTTAPDS